MIPSTDVGRNSLSEFCRSASGYRVPVGIGDDPVFFLSLRVILDLGLALNKCQSISLSGASDQTVMPLSSLTSGGIRQFSSWFAPFSLDTQIDSSSSSSSSRVQEFDMSGAFSATLENDEAILGLVLPKEIREMLSAPEANFGIGRQGKVLIRRSHDSVSLSNQTSQVSFVNGKPWSGEGAWITSDGRQVIGRWVHGVLAGPCLINNPNGTIWEGVCENALPLSGSGVWMHSEVKSVKGQWVEGRLRGQFTIHNSLGEIAWEETFQVEEVDESSPLSSLRRSDGVKFVGKCFHGLLEGTVPGNQSRWNDLGRHLS